jgi:hypothetical protein
MILAEKCLFAILFYLHHHHHHLFLFFLFLAQPKR